MLFVCFLCPQKATRRYVILKTFDEGVVFAPGDSTWRLQRFFFCSA